MPLKGKGASVRPTMKEVARRSNVSPGTVSRALAGSDLVNAATRERILQVVKELNYTPNLLARRLSTGRTLTIAVVVPFFTRPSVAERLNGVVSALAPTDYDLLIHDIETPQRRASCFQVLPRRGQVDGILVISVAPTNEEACHVLASDVPIVMIDADHPDLQALHRITVDDVAGGRLATRHLIDLGHSRIGFLGDPADNAFHFRSSSDRFQGYRTALEDAGIALDQALYAEGEHGREQARSLARGLLSRSQRPTAIFAASDTQAAGVLEAAADLGLSVPGNLSVIGYDDIEIAEVLGLTSVRQELFRSGQIGVELLMATLEGRDAAPRQHVLPTRIVSRRTTARPR